MIRDTWCILDDYVYYDYNAGALHSNTYTNESVARRLGRYDNIAVQAIVDEIDSYEGRLTVQLFHSGDGIEWLSGVDNVMISQVFTTESEIVAFGSDTTLGRMPFVKLFVATQVPKARVRLYVILRDPSD